MRAAISRSRPTSGQSLPKSCRIILGPARLIRSSRASLRHPETFSASFSFDGISALVEARYPLRRLARLHASSPARKLQRRARVSRYASTPPTRTPRLS